MVRRRVAHVLGSIAVIGAIVAFTHLRVRPTDAESKASRRRMECGCIHNVVSGQTLSIIGEVADCGLRPGRGAVRGVLLMCSADVPDVVGAAMRVQPTCQLWLYHGRTAAEGLDAVPARTLEFVRV